MIDLDFGRNTDHRVFGIVQGLRGWGPPRRRGMVEIVPRTRASSIRAIAISSSGGYGGLRSVGVLPLIFRTIRNACYQKESPGHTVV
jgi:hypothetical protein